MGILLESTPVFLSVVFLFVVGSIAVVQLNWALLIVATVIIVAGAVVGKVMQMMGMGKQTQDA